MINSKKFLTLFLVMKKQKAQYITVKGYDGKFKVTGTEGKYFKKVWARRPGESCEYCFPIEDTSYYEDVQTKAK